MNNFPFGDSAALLVRGQCNSFLIFGYGVYFAEKNIRPRKRSYKRFGDHVFLFLHAEAGDKFLSEVNSVALHTRNGIDLLI